ncbi:hypothetical protein [Nonomuraea jabiensis]|uniref:Uncharacterized protein n=1 Tax=Nonomuraea jabiensis TaxID=882448 RepID=A0A7W9GGF9_9ACTN|nr:hypothetical protein [Nonomuraea jabiensis]MBB5783339.1 hypothetical protein [Nonomuraea jabiensis]
MANAPANPPSMPRRSKEGPGRRGPVAGAMVARWVRVMSPMVSRVGAKVRAVKNASPSPG